MKTVKDLFLDLVKISSPSKNELNVANYIKDYLSKYPELMIVEDDSGEKVGSNTNNFYVEISGEKPYLLFDAHMDTVLPCENIVPIIDRDIIRSSGNTILGGNDKAGIAIMLGLIDELMQSDQPHLGCRFLFSICEETGLQGAKHINPKFLKEIDFIYSLDGEGEVGGIITQTPYSCNGILKIKGKEAHAGICPEEGINSLVVASDAINQLTIGRIDEETTCNIGIVSGGTARNIVMGEVELVFEARSFDSNKLSSVIENVKKTFSTTAENYGAFFSETLKNGTTGYSLSPSDPIVSRFRSACELEHITCIPFSCGGAGNANVFREMGSNAITLLVNMKNVHALNEEISINDLIKMQKLLYTLVTN